MTSIAEFQKQARIQDLQKIIRHHRVLYYAGLEQVSDATFDAFVDELRDLDPQDPVLFEVGAPVPSDSKWIKGQHKIPMGSQNKVNTLDEFRDWLSKIGSDLQYIIEDKLDGLSISIDYVNGSLIQAVTRGDGTVGEDITRNVINMQGVKRSLSTPETCSIRGEIVMLKSDFDRYIADAPARGWDSVSNPRNGASGISRRLDGTGSGYLTVMFYDVAGIDFASEKAKLKWIQKENLHTPFFETGPVEMIEEVFKHYEDELRESRDYLVDGMVIKVNRCDEAQAVEHRLDSGSLSDRNPKSQVAWKFEDEMRVTVLEDVIWQTGNSGRITPVAILKPVQIGGVTIKRASLHNFRNISELGLTLGAEVLVKRANEVIPQVTEVIKRTDRLIYVPTECNVCGSDTVRDGEYIVCPSLTCKARLAGNIRKWIKYLGVDYFGDALIDALVESGKLSTVADLYRLTEADLTALDRVGTRSAQRALRNLHAKRTIPLYLLFGSLNIPGFGRSLAKYLIEDGLDTPDKILSAFTPRLAAVPKFGEERAYFVREALQELEPLVRELLTLLEIQLPGDQSDPSVSGKLDGKSFCCTGKLSMTKKDMQAAVEAAGGTWAKSVNKDLDYLVCADPDSGSAKLQKAAKLGVAIISETQFAEMT